MYMRYSSAKYSYKLLILRQLFTNIVCTLYETFWNVIGTVTRHDYRDCVPKVWNKSANVRKSYKVLSSSMYLNQTIY